MNGDTFAVVDGKVQDLPTPEVKETVAEPEVKAKPTPDGAEPVEQPVKETEEPGDSVEVEVKPEVKETKAQKRIRELVEERNHYRDELLKKSPPEVKAAPVQMAARPRVENFETLEAFEEAEDEWLDQKVEAKFAAKEAQASTEKAQATISEKLKTATSKYQDFDIVAGPDSPLAPVMQSNPYMAQAVTDAPQFAEIAHYLGSNIPEAKRIAALSPLQAAVEIGILAAKLATPAPKAPVKEVSKAPEPVKTVTGGGAVETDDSKLSTSEWIKKQNKLEREKRR